MEYSKMKVVLYFLSTVPNEKRKGAADILQLNKSQFILL